ncbi:MAG: AI-2E family transporter, partial [Planctomycetales bacterium]|nr:AI-2E family transporter [Planctomycetales bacterium]
VLLPLAIVFGLAAREGYKQVTKFDSSQVVYQLNKLGGQLGFKRPFEADLVRLDQIMAELPDAWPAERDKRFVSELDDARQLLESFSADKLELPSLPVAAERTEFETIGEDDSINSKARKRMVRQGSIVLGEEADQAAECDSLSRVISIVQRAADELNDDGSQRPSSELDEDEADEPAGELPATEGVNAAASSDANNSNLAAEGDVIDVDAEDADDTETFEVPVPEAFATLKGHYQDFREALHGGAVRMLVTDFFHPDQSQLENWLKSAEEYMGRYLPSLTGQAAGIVTSVVAGLAIMILGMFYFLKDGPGMIRAAMRLSPLDDRYEQQLLSEFDSVSRAVVLATLLSAVAQGLLAGIGYFFAGVDALFLLTAMTVIIAMVPVVGAAAVWAPVGIWLIVVEERTLAGVLLMLYGAGVVSMVDNLIKPVVLHGQSNLHPLLALLSVLGGVQALGPIGILVGPMVVSFLQALLNMLNKELQEIDQHSHASNAAASDSSTEHSPSSAS